MWLHRYKICVPTFKDFYPLETIFSTTVKILLANRHMAIPQCALLLWRWHHQTASWLQPIYLYNCQLLVLCLLIALCKTKTVCKPSFPIFLLAGDQLCPSTHRNLSMKKSMKKKWLRIQFVGEKWWKKKKKDINIITEYKKPHSFKHPICKTMKMRLLINFSSKHLVECL